MSLGEDSHIAWRPDVIAVDGPWQDKKEIRIDPSKLVTYELDKPLDLGRRFDMALSLEVAEHLPASASQTFVQSLTRHSDLVVFGAATPFQGGRLHLNEKWQSYWFGLFEENNYCCYDIIRPKFWNDHRMVYYYRQNTLVYIRKDRHDLRKIAEGEVLKAAESPILDMINTDKYVETATYDVVLMRHLLKKLPRHLTKLAARKLKLS